jgi:hypothetical protein
MIIAFVVRRSLGISGHLNCQKFMYANGRCLTTVLVVETACRIRSYSKGDFSDENSRTLHPAETHAQPIREDATQWCGHDCRHPGQAGDQSRVAQLSPKNMTATSHSQPSGWKRNACWHIIFTPSVSEGMPGRRSPSRESLSHIAEMQGIFEFRRISALYVNSTTG